MSVMEMGLAFARQLVDSEDQSYLGRLKSWTDYRSFSEAFLVTCGVILAILASFLTCLGLGLQKLSLCAVENANINPWQQPKWVLGFSSMILGNIIDFLAFGLAPQSLLAPLAALSLVWNLFMSSYLLNEKYDKNDILACALIFFGTAITVIYSNHHEHEYKLAVLEDLYQKPRMYVYAVLTPLFLVLHYSLIQTSEKKNGTFWKLLGLVGWCGFAGITGGNSVLFAKSTVELLKDAFHGDDVFWHFDTYLIIIAMVICLLTQISFLNGAMKRYDQLYVLPVYQSYWIISGVIGGLVYFGEFEELSATQINFFVLGTIITLCGLYVLTKKEKHTLNNAGPQVGFEVLPSRRISEESFVGFENDDLGDIELEVSKGKRRFSPTERKFSRVSSGGSLDSDDARRRSGSNYSLNM